MGGIQNLENNERRTKPKYVKETPLGVLQLKKVHYCRYRANLGRKREKRKQIKGNQINMNDNIYAANTMELIMENSY